VGLAEAQPRSFQFKRHDQPGSRSQVQSAACGPILSAHPQSGPLAGGIATFVPEAAR
jgi:hypothetical protein